MVALMIKSLEKSRPGFATRLTGDSNTTMIGQRSEQTPLFFLILPRDMLGHCDAVTTEFLWSIPETDRCYNHGDINGVALC